ncbi:MAG TPA: GNAT family N-acetyltransferase [Pseudonocardiaceae bacterium]|nr:GNAT family N-acetyltransferase [Pseudonocardiaceae bacterium]
MRPTVRIFAERDLPAVIGLSLRAWAPVFESLAGMLGPSGVFPLLQPDWRAGQAIAVTEACTAEGAHAWVADADGEVAGFVVVGLDPSSGIGEIRMIAVDPGHQRRGIGSTLTSFAVGWMRDNGMAVAMVETGGDPGHGPARRAYEQAGFVQLPIARYFRKLTE